MTDKSGKPTSGWTDRELFISLLAVVNASNCKLNYDDAIYPPNRNASGFRQKMTALKKELKAEMDGTTPTKKAGADKTKTTPRKRKTKGSEDEETPKKRGRSKKSSPVVTEESEGEGEGAMMIKGEVEEIGSAV